MSLKWDAALAITERARQRATNDDRLAAALTPATTERDPAAALARSLWRWLRLRLRWGVGR